jgi:Domain of unknown function (DUF6894)
LERFIAAMHMVYMARYYFNTFDGDTPSHEDEVGEDLPTREAAWETATRFAAECLRDLDGKLRSDRDWRLEVTRADRSRVFQITIHAEDL